MIEFVYSEMRLRELENRRCPSKLRTIPWYYILYASRYKSRYRSTFDINYNNIKVVPLL